MPNQRVKNGLKAKKIKLPQMKFFSRKAIKFSCTYTPISFCKILKEFFELIQSYQDVLFSVTKWPVCPEQDFLVQTIIITFYLLTIIIYLLALFIVQNLKQILMADPKLWGCPIFGPKMVHLPQTIFFGKLLRSFSSNYQPYSLCKVSKKSLQWIWSYQDVQFLGIQWPICPNENFFQITC